MVRPNDDKIQFFLIFHNLQVQFDVEADGKVTLVEKGEPKFFSVPQEKCDLDELVAQMEENGLFAFPTDKSLEYLEKLDKESHVTNRAYSNIASVAHLKQVQGMVKIESL